MRPYLKNKTEVLIFKWVVFVKEVERKIKPFTRKNKNLSGEVLSVNVKLS